jgi:predicted nucleic acid-binding protein
MEILAGARDHHAARSLRRLLARAHSLPFDAAQDFEAAASIYRHCRAAGVSPCGLLDCTVATVALRTDAALLCRDVDLTRIASVVGVALDPATR